MLRFGIVGFGIHARKRMMPAFTASKHATVTALSQRSLDRARATADEFGVPHAFDSVEELCNCPDVDAVFVATPNIAHLENTVTALLHGKHVLCEKPMAMNAGECRRMVEAARRAGRLLGVAQVFRFTDTIPEIRSRISSGAIGRPVLANATYVYEGRGHARTWINNREIGGGVIADVGVHCIDALRYVLNDEVVEVQAFAACDSASGEADCAGTVNLQFSRGTLATVAVSMRTPYRTSLEVTGEHGRVTSDLAFSVDSDVKVQTYLNNTLQNETLHQENRAAFTRLVDAFAIATERGEPFLAPGIEGYRNQLILDAAYESAATGKVIRISEDQATTALK